MGKRKLSDWMRCTGILIKKCSRRKYKSEFYRWFIYSFLYILSVVTLWFFIQRIAFGVWGFPDLTGTDFVTPALYFFSAVAQTMGALLAITFTVFYVSIQNFYKKDFKEIDGEDREIRATRYLREVVAFEPLKRIMLNDEFLKIAYSSGIVSILLSVLGLILVYSFGSKSQVCYIGLPILVPVVVAGLVIGVTYTIKFIGEKLSAYSNPVAYMLRNGIEKDNIFIQIDENKFADEFLLLFYIDYFNGIENKQSLFGEYFKSDKSDAKYSFDLSQMILDDIRRNVYVKNEMEEILCAVLSLILENVNSFKYDFEYFGPSVDIDFKKLDPFVTRLLWFSEILLGKNDDALHKKFSDKADALIKKDTSDYYDGSIGLYLRVLSSGDYNFHLIRNPPLDFCNHIIENYQKLPQFVFFDPHSNNSSDASIVVLVMAYKNIIEMVMKETYQGRNKSFLGLSVYPILLENLKIYLSLVKSINSRNNIDYAFVLAETDIMFALSEDLLSINHPPHVSPISIWPLVDVIKRLCGGEWDLEKEFEKDYRKEEHERLVENLLVKLESNSVRPIV